MTDQCAHIGPLGALCDSPPAWTIVTAENPYELIDACSLHVGDLLIAGTLNYVWATVDEGTLTWPCRACGNDTRLDDVDCWEPDGRCLCAHCSREDH